MPDDVRIRAATQADAHAIADIHVDGWRWAYEGLVPPALLDSLSVERREARWTEWFAQHRPGWAVFVAEGKSGTVGFVSCGPCNDPDAGPETGEVYAIYLRHGVQGQGVGRNLFARASEHLRDSGFRQATLWVLAENAPTRRFYERAGWTPDGAEKTEDWNGYPLKEVRYRMRPSDR